MRYLGGGYDTEHGLHCICPEAEWAGGGGRFIIQALMPIVDPEMVSIRLMLVGVDKRIDRAQMEPSLKGGITKTPIAVRSKKPGSSWLTVIGQGPLYWICQGMPGTAQATLSFVPTLI